LSGGLITLHHRRKSTLRNVPQNFGLYFRILVDHSNKTSGSTKGKEFSDYVSNISFSKNPYEVNQQ
jgi:hypothetical protein